MKALVYGEIIWDVYPDSEVIGGAAFNFAAHLSHMGVNTCFISAVGEDSLGDRAVSEVKKHGISGKWIRRNSAPTGACIVSLREGGIPGYQVFRDVSYDKIQLSSGDISDIQSFPADFFYFNTLCQRGKESREALKQILSECSFPEVVCDINLRKDCYDEDSLRRCMETATVVKISDEEGQALFESGLLRSTEKDDPSEMKEPSFFTRAAAEAFPNLKLVVYTLGEKGSAVLDTKNNVLYESGLPRKTRVVSTVGAGDCYGAAFCYAYFSGHSVPEAVSYAAEMSAQVVENQDAVPLSMYE